MIYTAPLVSAAFLTVIVASVSIIVVGTRRGAPHLATISQTITTTTSIAIFTAYTIFSKQPDDLAVAALFLVAIVSLTVAVFSGVNAHYRQEKQCLNKSKVS